MDDDILRKLGFFNTDEWWEKEPADQPYYFIPEIKYLDIKELVEEVVTEIVP